MKFKKLPSFKDNRGKIIDIVEGIQFDSVTLITFVASSIRAEHFHRKTLQYNYLISGRLLYRSRKDFGMNISELVLKSGDLVVSNPGEHHAFKAISNSKLLCITHGPRSGFNYEKDTFRLDPKDKLFSEVF